MRYIFTAAIAVLCVAPIGGWPIAIADSMTNSELSNVVRLAIANAPSNFANVRGPLFPNTEQYSVSTSMQKACPCSQKIVDDTIEGGWTWSTTFTQHNTTLPRSQSYIKDLLAPVLSGFTYAGLNDEGDLLWHGHGAINVKAQFLEIGDRSVGITVEVTHLKSN